MSDAPDRQARVPLRAVMRRTGLSADVIRAWERRYRAVEPQRSAGGQRLYSERDVVRLSLLARATAQGHSIGEIARLDGAALESLLRADGARHSGDGEDLVAAAVSDALGAAAALDSGALEAVLKRAALSLGVDRFVDDVVGRFLAEVGNRWHEGAMSPAHEHVASDTMRRVLAWVWEAYDVEPDAPRMVVATPSGEMHELGAMTAAAAAVSEGWRVVYLGANLPARDISNAAAQVGAHVIALSVVYANGDSVSREVSEVARSVPDGVEVVVGGSGAHTVESAVKANGVRVLAGIDSFRRMLRAARPARSGIAQPRVSGAGRLDKS
jgi:DNA-binding transcriptional MerR regulator/methylmalonyl-CoA mutase cobalamin-binding subunit